MGEHRVTAVDHVGIAVPDLDAAIAWYASTFGLVATHTETNDEQGVREAMLSAPGDAGSGGPAAGPAAAGLADRTVPRAQRTGHPADGLPGDRHRRELRRPARPQGVRLLYDEPRRGTAGSRINFVHPRDAGGVLVELVEPAADPHP